MKQDFTFNIEQFNRIFPFYLLVDKKGTIISVGKSLLKVCNFTNSENFFQYFSIVRPASESLNWESIGMLKDQLVIIRPNKENSILLRGQFEFVGGEEKFLFIGSPWFNSVEELIEKNFYIEDFALYDPVIDMLHSLKTQEIVNADLKEFVDTINSQKIALEKANKEVNSVALFIDQNPDPQIKIDFYGEVVSNNPAASRLDFIEFEKVQYRNDLFFKELVKKIDFSQPKMMFEAMSNDTFYSFICVPIIGERRINIYGSDVTQRKKDEEKLRVLSQIAEDNLNPVIIADKEGKITWVNRSFVEMTEYSLEEVIGRKPGEILQGPETDPDSVSYLRSQIQQGLPFHTDIVNYTKSGKKYWLRIQGQAIKDKFGEISGFFALEEDITREKESEDRFRKALENISDNVWEHDFATGQTYFSKMDNEFLGYKTDELTNNVQLWWDSVVDEDRKILEQNDQNYRSGKIEAHSLEYRIKHKDGSIKWVLDRGVVIEKDRNGKALRITGTHTDISSLYQTKLELSNRVKQFQSLSENIPGVLYEYEFRLDGTQRLRYVSPAIERIFGISIQDFENYLEYIHPDDRDTVIGKNKQSRKYLTPFYCEARLCIPGQPLRWHSVHSSFSYYSETGSAVFTGVMLDITDRKQVQQELEVQREFYEQILNNIPADIAVFSPTHEYLFVNPRGIKDTELRKWIIGKRDEDYCEYRNKPMSIAQERRKKFNAVVQEKKPLDMEERLVSPQGKEQYLLRRWYPVLDKLGKISMVIGYGIDITDRKLSENALRENEEKYRSIIENMNLGLIEVDTQTNIVYANNTFEKMTGVNQESMLKKSVFNFFTEAGIESFKSHFESKLYKKNAAYEAQVHVKGEEGWWFISSTPKYSSEGEFMGSIFICLDISKQKELERELIRSREQAEQLARTKETFLANMSHEIRTPMNAIIGMGNQLAKTDVSEKQQTFIKAINNASENLLVIINDILDLSKIEAGKLSIENIAFSPKELLQHALQVVNYKAEEKGLWLTNSVFSSKTSDVLIGDPYRVNQVLLNLLSNAVKFTEKGGVDVRIELVKDSAISQTIKVSVDDTGIGMEPEFMDILFDKFSQEVNPGLNKYGGTGLGMSICRELVELMGGSILVTSKKGVGTSISFTLSFTKGSSEDIQQNSDAVLSADVLKGKTILVVDDNEMNRLVATTILEFYEVKLLEAVNGEEAVSVIRSESVDIVLMDIQMPVLNGYEATKIIREFNKNVPIIALTANAIKGENERCFEVGMNDYITKPFKEEELINKILHWTVGTKSAIERLSDQAPKNSEKRYNLAELQLISRGNDGFVKKMVTMFCDLSPQMIQDMKQLLVEEKLEEISGIAHKFKSSVRNLQITSLYELLRNIEKAEEKDFLNGSLKNWIEEAEVIVKEVVIGLKKEVGI